jgi:hypothetical protein
MTNDVQPNGIHCPDHRECLRRVEDLSLTSFSKTQSVERQFLVLQKSLLETLNDMQSALTRATEHLAKSEAVEAETLSLLKTLAARKRK